MKIILLKTWFGNIGDGFVKKGANVCLRRAFPNAEIIESSVLGNIAVAHSGIKLWAKWIGKKRNVGRYLLEFGKKRTENDPKINNIINIGELIDADLVVLSGCVLNIYLEMFMKTLQKIRSKDIPLIFLGVGGNNYTPITYKYVRDILERLSPNVLISRDPVVYNLYSDLFDFSYDGIDCGFYINEWHSPPRSKEKFIVATFNQTAEPKIDTPYKVIRPFHFPLASPFTPFSYDIITRLKYFSFLKKPNVFISDNIEDYLFLYSNAKEIHSDLVHACVAGLAYGNPVRFYFDTPRANLFNKLLDQDIRKNLVTIDKNKLKREKEKQALALKKFISKI